jgi:hypothetical protein
VVHTESWPGVNVMCCIINVRIVRVTLCLSPHCVERAPDLWEASALLPLLVRHAANAHLQVSEESLHLEFTEGRDGAKAVGGTGKNKHGSFTIKGTMDAQWRLELRKTYK